MNICEIYKRFPTNTDCIKYLETVRWGETPICTYCGSSNSSPNRKENRHHCNGCNKSFSVKAKTIFHHSNLSIQKWFLAISLIINAKKGISSLQLSRDLDVNKDTAWYIQMRIRKAMLEQDMLLSGIVEVDETYIGGDLKNKTKKYRNQRDKMKIIPRGMEHKQPVVGMLARKGRVVSKVIEKAYGEVLKPILKETIDKNSTLVTDGFGGYYGLNKYFHDHQVINHQQDEFVRGCFHTNTIESFWSTLKRGITGQYHHVSIQHLQKYIDEFSFRYNYRNKEQIFDLVLQRAVNRSLASP